MFDILAIEDDLRMRELLKEILSRAGCSVFTAKNGEEGLDFLERRTFDLVITDLKMPDIDGITILSKAREFNPEGLVIVITAYGTVESAIEAMKLGAYDYIQKPFEPEELMLVIKKALDYKRLADENLRLSSQLESCKAEEMIGASPRITEVKRLVDRIAPLDITVVIEGETGTGKNLVAKTIHRISKRASGKFLSINCGALTETLLESELFGHEKGAFTGAVKQKHGLFEAAHGGTLFLDEINSASPGMQIKLLKVLEDGMIMRIGSTETVPVDVRIIAASNILLKKEIDESRFRQDLYYRLKVVTITMPSLRERRDDIPLLAHHFRDRYRGKFSKDITGFTTEAMDALLTYDWPGNVRELEHVIERSVILEYGKKIDISSLPAEVVSRPREILSPKGIVRLEDMERQLIQSALRFFNGKRDSAARALGISHATLWRKVKKYNLD
ncbi:MAG: sigma-54-dependent Fis family transcriptional regulator [Nitrospirae bacterium GWB2_47_37]|nr:MAG: sigma-54-dependent Fis family transcriptional regulator [Nitrospirae bacterium GWA2_46_11]OGW24713.1 MAG: sigma-54-dependent Fis family transcriptional regulator [Nitrospirae bacterium GWB2_47_37]HAK88445.1 sigma-54-dependent Fis family transcriptional regulator [Nitrospiraceae bacterium]